MMTSWGEKHKEKTTCEGSQWYSWTARDLVGATLQRGLGKSALEQEGCGDKRAGISYRTARLGLACSRARAERRFSLPVCISARVLSGSLPRRLASLTRGIPVWRNLGLKKSGTHSPLQAVAGLELWPGCPGTSVGRPRNQPVCELAAWERSREVSESFEYCRKKHHRLANG